MAMHPEQLPICSACGTQFDLIQEAIPQNCKICDDPRQFVPSSGQSWTTLAKLQETHQNKWQQDATDPRVSYFWTEPKFAIGQRAILLQTSAGNILWDMIALLDSVTIDKIGSLGGLKAIVISHPHYYTTYVEWSKSFRCPIYVSADDQEWLSRKPPEKDTLRLIDGPSGTTKEILPGVTAIKTGGHFPGSLVLHWERKLFIADSMVTIPSAHSPHPRPLGQSSYAFAWSIPNMIPLPPDEILKIWHAIKPFGFDMTYGAFVGTEVRDDDLKNRVLESMKIQVRGEGWERHEVLEEVVG